MTGANAVRLGVVIKMMGFSPESWSPPKTHPAVIHDEAASWSWSCWGAPVWTGVVVTPVWVLAGFDCRVACQAASLPLPLSVAASASGSVLGPLYLRPWRWDQMVLPLGVVQ